MKNINQRFQDQDGKNFADAMIHNLNEKNATILDIWGNVAEHWDHLTESQRDEIILIHKKFLETTRKIVEYSAQPFLENAKKLMSQAISEMDGALNAFNLKISTRSGRKEKSLYYEKSIVLDEDLKQMYERMGLEEIAQKCHVSRNTIANRLEAMGVNLKLSNAIKVEACSKCGRPVRFWGGSCELFPVLCEACDTPKSMCKADLKNEAKLPSDFSPICPKCGKSMHSADTEFRSKNTYVCACGFSDQY